MGIDRWMQRDAADRRESEAFVSRRREKVKNMARKRASKKKPAAPAAPDYSFRTYGSPGAFMFALVRGKDGATLMYSNVAAPFKTLAAAHKGIDEVVTSIQREVVVLKSTD